MSRYVYHPEEPKVSDLEHYSGPKSKKEFKYEFKTRWGESEPTVRSTDKNDEDWLAAMERVSPPKANDRQVGGDHYKRMAVQPWDFVDAGPNEQAIGFYRWNAFKYIARAGEKGDFVEDIRKAEHYLQKLIEIIEKNQTI